MGIYEELVWRGLIKDVSSPELKDRLNQGGSFFTLGLIQPEIVYTSVIFHLF